MASIALTRQTAGPPTVEEWAKLDLNVPNSHVLKLTRVRLEDNNVPLAVEEVVLALERFPGLTANGSDVPDIVELARLHGISLGDATERVSIVRATKDVASHLQIAVGTDVLRLNRIVATVDGDPVEWRRTFRKI
jgi:DNA-binding GntR family transcriptional regulator